MLKQEKKNLGRVWKIKLLLPIISLTILLSGCLNEDSTPLPPAAYVSFYHGSPDAPALDVNVDGRKITDYPFHFSEAIPYNRFYIGERQFKFSPANAVNNLLEKNLIFEQDKVYSVFLADEMPNLKAFVLEDDWEDPNTNQASIRFVHLSPDAGIVEVNVSGKENSFAAPVSFMNDGEFEKLDKGTYTFTIKSQVNGEVLVNAASVEIKGNRVYTLVLRGKKSLTDGDKKLNLQLLTNHIQY